MLKQGSWTSQARSPPCPGQLAEGVFVVELVRPHSAPVRPSMGRPELQWLLFPLRCRLSCHRSAIAFGRRPGARRVSRVAENHRTILPTLDPGPVPTRSEEHTSE